MEDGFEVVHMTCINSETADELSQLPLDDTDIPDMKNYPSIVAFVTRVQSRINKTTCVTP